MNGWLTDEMCSDRQLSELLECEGQSKNAPPLAERTEAGGAGQG